MHPHNVPRCPALRGAGRLVLLILPVAALLLWAGARGVVLWSVLPVTWRGTLNRRQTGRRRWWSHARFGSFVNVVAHVWYE